MGPSAQDQDQMALGQVGNHLQHPRIQAEWGGSLQQGRQGKSWGQLEEGIHLGHLVHTFHFLLLGDLQGKAHVNMAREVLLVQREMVQLGMSPDPQGAVRALPQEGTAQGIGLGLLDWKETALVPLVETDPESQDQAGTHQVPMEVLDIALVLQDPSEMGTGQEPLGQMCHQGSHSERRAGLALLELNQATRGL